MYEACTGVAGVSWSWSTFCDFRSLGSCWSDLVHGVIDSEKSHQNSSFLKRVCVATLKAMMLAQVIENKSACESGCMYDYKGQKWAF